MSSALLFADLTTTITIIVVIVVLVFGLILFAVFANYFRLWIQSFSTGAGIGIFDIIGMTFRKVNPSVIVRSKIMAVQSGLGDESGITVRSLQAHYMANGRVPLVVRAMIMAAKAKILELDFKTATAIDLAGRDVLDAVQTSVYPKVIDCPARSSGKETLEAVAKNGIQLKVKARVTVRTNIEQLIGGATEQTIIARVGEGIVSAIGSADSHWEVLAHPDLISKTVLARKLDSQTAFEIVSIDIANLEPGENIGAKLAADRATADLRVAQAEAEKRRAAAVALEQEMQAKVAENRAKVVEAEALVPMAIAEAFKTGRLGVMEYYSMKNLQSDTTMRSNIANMTGNQDK